jgi:hypothetical protein
MNSEEMKKIQEEQRKQGAGNEQEELMKMLPSFMGGRGGAGADSDSD